MHLLADIVPADKLKVAFGIAGMLYGNKKEKQYARLTLCVLTFKPPWRPLFYLKRELMMLPRNTRNCVRYLGDYVDLLAKELAFEFVKGDARSSSLGRNAKAIGRIASLEDLSLKLQRYSQFIYTPGKHDFNLPPGRSHRFTPEEVVLTAYVTMELGERSNQFLSGRERRSRKTAYTR